MQSVIQVKNASTYTEVNLADAIQDIYFHHDDQDGYIALGYLQNNQLHGQKHFTFEELPTALEHYLYHYENVCFSQNTYKRKSRQAKYLHTLSSLYVDIDCYNKGYTANEVLSLIRSNFGREIPHPNVLKFSGGGLTLIWLLEECTNVKEWKAVATAITSYFEKLDIGVDSKSSVDPTRIFRVSGTVNSKYGVSVKTEVLHDYRYNFEDIKKWHHLFEVTPPLETKKVDDKKNKSAHHKQTRQQKNINKVKYLYNDYTLYSARCEDIIKLCQLGKFNQVGCREYALFLYRYWKRNMGVSKEEALEQTLQLNAMFGQPLDEYEVINATSTENKLEKMEVENDEGYRYTNERLIQIFSITDEEQKHLKTIISKEEVKRRDREYQYQKRIANGGVSREEYLEKEANFTDKQLQYLKSILEEQPKIKKTKLAEMMGINRSHLYRLLKQI